MAAVQAMFVVLAAVLACSLAHPQYPPPHHAPAYKHPARPYSYSYAVVDDYKGLNFGADESSDGNSVKGSYQVALPDGRTQNVAYTADHYAGYVADVSYKGHATYPPPAPYHPPAPYRPAPYHPTPAPYRPVHG
ncbi:cuticle protein 7-like [Penaeus vannamei]|uniref:cuticle protein 7-like n=1 Tax=Penaeus vannamei TaxID=6689 RepID=UPI00387F8A43